MGRTKKTPWQLTRRENSRAYQVEFRHGGRRFRESTGCNDPRAAATEAARIYAEVVAGKRDRAAARRVNTRAGSTKLDVLFAEWLASLQSTLDRTTVRNYEMYARAHLLRYFKSLDQITTLRCTEYRDARLLKVQAGTVRKEQSCLRGFLNWCVDHGHLHEDDFPVVKPVSKRTTGTPSDKFRKVAGWIDLTPEEAHAIIAAAPVFGRNKRPIRAYFQALWETGLRPETIVSIEAPRDYRRGSDTLRIRADADKAR